MSITHINIKVGPTGLQTLTVAAGSDHWAHKYPHLAAFLAGDLAENSGPDAVHDELMASEDEAKQAERQLFDYDYRLCYAMGYHKLMPSPLNLPAGEDFMAEIICGRYY